MVSRYIIRTYCLPVFWLIVLQNVICAQKQDSLKHYYLKTVKVAEERFTPEEEGMSSKIINLTQINNIPSMEISDVLKFMTGLSIKDYGGMGGIKTVSVRSLGANHTAVSYDGLCLNNCNSGQINISMLPVENIEYMQLYSGSGTDIFQPARTLASASTLSVITHRPEFSKGKKVNVKASIKMGSFHFYNPLYILFENKLWKYFSSSILAEYCYQKGDYPYECKNYDNIIKGIRKNAEVGKMRAEGNLFFKKRNEFSLQKAFVKLHYYQCNQQLPGAVIYYNPYCRQTMDESDFFIQLHYETHFGKNEKKWHFQNNEKVNFNNLNYYDPDYLNSAGFLENYYDQKEYYASNTVVYNFKDFLDFSLGNDLFKNEMQSNLSNFKACSRISSLSALQTKFHVFPKRKNKLDITASILHNYIYEEDGYGKKIETGKLCPSLNLHLGVSGFNFRMFYKNIFRMPTFSEQYCRFFLGPKLKPEEVEEFDFGCGWKKISHTYSINFNTDVYYNKVSDKIVAVPNQNLFVWSMLNYGKVDACGLEIGFNSEKHFSEKYVSLYVDLTYAYQKAIDVTDAKKKTYKHQLPYTPKHSATAMFSVKYKNTALSYTILFVGERYALGQNIESNRLNPYTDCGVVLEQSLPISKKGGKRLNFRFEVFNILNHHYEIIRNYPMPGRQFQGKIGVNF